MNASDKVQQTSRYEVNLNENLLKKHAPLSFKTGRSNVSIPFKKNNGTSFEENFHLNLPIDRRFVPRIWSLYG